MHIYNHVPLSEFQMPTISQMIHNVEPIFKITRDYHPAIHAGLPAICKAVCVRIGGLDIKCSRNVKVSRATVSGMLLVYGFGLKIQHIAKFSPIFRYFDTLTISHILTLIHSSAEQLQAGYARRVVRHAVLRANRLATFYRGIPNPLFCFQ